jgi:hypothetical protein
MTDTIEGAFRAATASIEHLVRVIVRDELRRHLGPAADHLINVKQAPMSATKLRRLVRAGELKGFKHGRDVFISASEFQAYLTRKPAPPAAHVVAPEPSVDPDQDGIDDVFVELGCEPSDPQERRAFEARLAQRRAEGGERSAALRRAEMARERHEEDARRRDERRRKREARKALGGTASRNKR